MKKMSIILLSTAGLLLANGYNENTSPEKEIKKIKQIIIKQQKEIKKLKKEIKKIKKKDKKVNKKIRKKFRTITKKLNPMYTNTHIYFRYRLKTAVDFIHYKLSNGKNLNNTILSNKISLVGVAKPSDNLKATLELAAYNIFGMNENKNLYFDNNNDVASETPDDTYVRVKKAFFNYTFGNGKYMISTGRRPATEGVPANYREGDPEGGAMGHILNTEFDGISFKIEPLGMPSFIGDNGGWFKLCFGRGYSPNVGKYSQTPYAKSKNSLHANDFFSLMFVPIDNGQTLWLNDILYSLNNKGYYDVDGDGKKDFADVGTFLALNTTYRINGIGNGLSEFLDNSKFFISYSYMIQKPKAGRRMDGSNKQTYSNSVWLGFDVPMTENGRFGINFVHGSKYFRSMSYGEETLIGSIATTRGNAYEFYFTKEIIPHLSISLRGTFIDYKYTGSNALFGDYSTPYDINSDKAKEIGAAKTARDIRLFIRYRF